MDHRGSVQVLNTSTLIAQGSIVNETLEHFDKRSTEGNRQGEPMLVLHAQVRAQGVIPVGNVCTASSEEFILNKQNNALSAIVYWIDHS